VNVRKRVPQHPDHTLQTLPALLLSRQRIKLNEILLHKFIGSFIPTLVNNFFYESLESGNILNVRQVLFLRESIFQP